MSLPKLGVFDCPITGPTTPAIGGVTVHESILWDKWRKNPNTDPITNPYPYGLHEVLNHGTETIAIIPTLDKETKKYPAEIAKRCNAYPELVEVLLRLSKNAFDAGVNTDYSVHLLIKLGEI